jgi:hypothetical protein
MLRAMGYVNARLVRMHAGGDWADEMFLIYRGVVRIVELSEELGHGIYLKDGDYFGEIAVLTGGRRMMSVRAVTYCHLYSLQQKLLERILQQHPDCINNLLVNMMGACEQPCSPDPVARRANGRAPSRPPCLPGAGRLATARLGFEAGVRSRTASVICSACSRMFCSRTVSFPLAPLLAFFAHPLPAHVRLGRSVAFSTQMRTSTRSSSRSWQSQQILAVVATRATSDRYDRVRIPVAAQGRGRNERACLQ